MKSKKFDEARTGTGTREWAEVTENIQVGCPHNCLYCYAAQNAQRFKLRERDEWDTEVLTKKAERTSYPAREGVVMFPSTHDITPFNVDAYIRVASLILKKGNRLLIVSKPHWDCMDKTMRALEAYREQILFRFTLGAMDEQLTRFWEPGAPSPLERLNVLDTASGRGFATSISIEPMLAGVEETVRVVENVLPAKPQTVWVGKMNRPRSRIPINSTEIEEAICRIEKQQRDEEILRLCETLKDISEIRWKDSIKTVLGEQNN